MAAFEAKLDLGQLSSDVHDLAHHSEATIQVHSAGKGPVQELSGKASELPQGLLFLSKKGHQFQPFSFVSTFPSSAR